MATKSRWFPFTAEQTVNILSEFGPLVTMFVVNAMYGKSDPELFHGTVALISTTVLAMITMWFVLHRLPVFPVIASAVTVVFGLLTIITKNPADFKALHDLDQRHSGILAVYQDNDPSRS